MKINADLLIVGTCGLVQKGTENYIGENLGKMKIT